MKCFEVRTAVLAFVVWFSVMDEILATEGETADEQGGGGNDTDGAGADAQAGGDSGGDDDGGSGTEAGDNCEQVKVSVVCILTMGLSILAARKFRSI